MASPENKRLVADFDRDWPGVTRTREMLVLAEEFVPGELYHPSSRANAGTDEPRKVEMMQPLITRNVFRVRWLRIGPGMTDTISNPLPSRRDKGHRRHGKGAS